ncbi:MAG: hypothetical protein JW749_04590 [Sedimentisphaerales bacterium]|nr:hypothetical protein [Sedimentisphaerales bacterium]
MRSALLKTLLAACLILALAGAGTIAFAGEMEKEEQITSPPPPVPEENPPERRFQPRAEHIERILAEIKEENPGKAEELIQLRDKDPNAFRLEIRKATREKFRRGMKEQMGEMPMRQRGSEALMKTRGLQGENHWIGRGGPGMMQEWMKDKHVEYTIWLAKNYPDEAAKLNDLQEKNPEQYMRAVVASGRKYWPIFQASRDNPQLASVLKEQLALREQRAELIKQVKATTDEKEKELLTADLEKIVAQSFDLIVKRKEIACEDISNRLAELTRELDHKKTEIEKWKTQGFKNEKVKQRINELLSEKERFEWD